ncbi:MAG: FMN-binding protein, partial [Elusimicrobiales bacterium]|nr:FMN-binding protein [Elusimicrobiales bacterium]
FDWKVKKDGGFVDELTAATISSRAATDAVKKGLEEILKKYFSGNKK